MGQTYSITWFMQNRETGQRIIGNKYYVDNFVNNSVKVYANNQKSP